jgi:Mg2+ and Co2+ transporter CorA
MRKSKSKVERYLRVRIDMLCEERKKNNNEVAHMVIDKCVGELSYVLELIERENNANN